MQKIDVRIPYEPGGKLGEDYNRIMAETIHDWVLFLDHDVFLPLNPNWYHICQMAIENEDGVGMFTCRTNAPHGNTGQQEPNAPDNDRLFEHMDFAKKVWEENEFSCSELDKISGYFMLVNKKAWESVEGFPGKAMFKEDWGFSKKLRKKGYRLMIMNGLYVYHMKKRTGSLIDGVDTTKEIKAKRDAEKKK